MAQIEMDDKSNGKKPKSRDFTEQLGQVMDMDKERGEGKKGFLSPFLIYIFFFQGGFRCLVHMCPNNRHASKNTKPAFWSSAEAIAGAHALTPHTDINHHCSLEENTAGHFPQGSASTVLPHQSHSVNVPSHPGMEHSSCRQDVFGRPLICVSARRVNRLTAAVLTSARKNTPGAGDTDAKFHRNILLYHCDDIVIHLCSEQSHDLLFIYIKFYISNCIF